ncbi:CDP-alcohol phosphatidyltransferase family protein [Actinomadura kijaniata]|uniref:CDP-alcohol phosphatidyltransferase family protein n=1 Tax=Actinomadura kijaniata TaxID=46161 RepID=UPI003F1CDFD3
MATFSLEDVRAVCKERDAWWTVLLVDPVAVRLTRLVANRTRITPDQITLAAFALGLGAAACFLRGTAGWLALGAALYHLCFVLDCVDGKLARLKGTGTPFGGWLDYMLDRVRDACCAITLAVGQYLVTGQVGYLALGFAVIVLDMVRYLNGPQIAKFRRLMSATLLQRGGEADPAEDAVADPAGPAAGPARRPELDRQAAGRYPRYLRLRRHLTRHRVRTHLVSGIEFQMAVFIVGPLTGTIVAMTVATGALLLAFECAIIYKFWLTSRQYVRTLARLDAETAAGPVATLVPRQERADAPAVRLVNR